tara:strand:+ start:1813 stop:2112 length:300 start_codon:yes stop_codon:yes gene_type:complete
MQQTNQTSALFETLLFDLKMNNEVWLAKQLEAVIKDEVINDRWILTFNNKENYYNFIKHWFDDTDGFSDNMRQILREYVTRIHGAIKLCLKVDPYSWIK